jgi:hypothetical protein
VEQTETHIEMEQVELGTEGTALVNETVDLPGSASTLNTEEAERLVEVSL